MKQNAALKLWLDARRRHHLTHAQVQMARELGLNPAKLGATDNHDREPWKAPLPVFIEDLYEKHFGRRCPEVVVTLEERAAALARKTADKRARKAERRKLGEGH